MNRRLNIAWSVAVVAVIAMLATGAAAQVIAKDAKFTLPFTAHWDGMVLPPGDYTVNVLRSPGQLDVYRVEVTGNDMKQAIVAFTRPGPRAKTSMLVVEEKGTAYTIRELHLAKADLALTFPHGAKAEKTSLAKTSEPGVPIQIALK